ncbi:hypothetical protein [Pseudomonas sp.]|uniref:hypothetical protein n=1 Tax=Pseudomonas sp. TaxID=306 RepID=UPI0025833585|nr:hypothetical protein [Pseudomonas sp.]
MIIQCICCEKEFTPTNKKHKFCGNTCVVRSYYQKVKIRNNLESLLKQFKDPEKLKELNQEMHTFFERYQKTEETSGAAQ